MLPRTRVGRNPYCSGRVGKEAGVTVPASLKPSGANAVGLKAQDNSLQPDAVSSGQWPREEAALPPGLCPQGCGGSGHPANLSPPSGPFSPPGRVTCAQSELHSICSHCCDCYCHLPWRPGHGVGAQGKLEALGFVFVPPLFLAFRPPRSLTPGSQPGLQGQGLTVCCPQGSGWPWPPR